MTNRGTGRRRGRCGKVLFRDEIGAKFALARMQRLDKGQSRIYECDICFGHVWHVTSQEPDPDRKSRGTGANDPQSIDGENFQAIG